MRPLKASLSTLLILATGASSLPAQRVERTPPPADAPPQDVQPPAPAPRDAPPPPPALRPDPPVVAPTPRPVEPRREASGQWVYTDQYGWVWMPYGSGFTHVPPDGGTPSMYVYYPEMGWTWVVAPWLWGWGPRPYFGVVGPRFFGWWGVGLGHWYGFRGGWGYPGHMVRGTWGGGHWNGVVHFGGGRRGGRVRR